MLRATSDLNALLARCACPSTSSSGELGHESSFHRRDIRRAAAQERKDDGATIDRVKRNVHGSADRGAARVRRGRRVDDGRAARSVTWTAAKPSSSTCS